MKRPVDRLDGELFQAYNDVLGRLYLDCTALEEPHFKHRALELVRELIPFDSAAWIKGGVLQGVPVAYDTCLYNQPDGFMENYAKYADRDHLAEQAMCAPGQTVDLYDLVSREHWVQTTEYQAHCRIYGIEHAISTAHLEQATGIFSFVSLYREDYARPFSSEEKLLSQYLSGHLLRAEELNHMLYVRRQSSAIGTNESFAGCNPEGVLTYCEERFVACLRDAWPEWHGPVLPDALVALVKCLDPRPYREAEYLFRVIRWQGGILVTARLWSLLDLLSPRELEIARYLAGGWTYKQIARDLAISSSTVTNHANSIYRKLDISNKQQLAQILA